MSPLWAGGLVSRQNSENETIVDFIGSVDSGTMPDPDNEGHSGAEINAIGGYLMPDLSQNPNVVFLLSGTNNINNGNDVDGAPAWLMAVVDTITSTLPNTAVLVGTILLNGDPAKEALADTFNYNIIRMLLRRASDGARIMPVPAESLGPDDMADSLHSNSVRCGKRRNGVDRSCHGGPVGNWQWKGILLENPVWYLQGEIANGASLGVNGGLYDRSLVVEAPTECSCEFTEPDQPEQVFPTPSRGQCSDLNDNSTAVRFADLNGDRRAEYLWLDTKGVTTALLNLVATATGESPLLYYPRISRIDAGQVQWLLSTVITTGVGANRSQVHFADLNGDRRAEYLWVDDDGSAAKFEWYPAGEIVTGIGKDGKGGCPAANVGWLPQDVVATGPANGATRDNATVEQTTSLSPTGGVVELMEVALMTVQMSVTLSETLYFTLSFHQAAKVVWYPQGIIATGVGTSGMGVQWRRTMPTFSERLAQWMSIVHHRVP
ncbi:hypothetical protein B0H13DRAFT_1934186 [Mycena leptocephala]|nr:hypothetical protein B0H13DRAFT_1934186 [Mycena leptocephala]